MTSAERITAGFEAAARNFTRAILPLADAVRMVSLRMSLAFEHHPLRRLRLRWQIACLQAVMEGRWLREVGW